MPTSCKPHANLVQTSCKPHANLMQTPCKPNADLVQTLCRPHANLRQTSCKPHADLVHYMYSNWSKLVLIFHRSGLDLDQDLDVTDLVTDLV